MTELWEAITLLGSLLFFSIISFKKKSLDRDGILIANAVGITIFLFGGLISFFVTVLFFVIAEFSTKVARKQTRIPHEKRTTGNILGNSLAALIALFFSKSIGLIPFYAGIAAALSDTVSSEIGLTSKAKPRLITTFEEVEPGTDGGITLLGLISGLIAAIIIALFYYFIIQPEIKAFIIITIAGFIGTLADSLFGALFEREHKLNNMQVNFLGSLAGVLTALMLSTLMF